MRDYEVLLNALNAMSNKSSCYYCQGETLVCEAHGCILSNAADAVADFNKMVNRIEALIEKMQNKADESREAEKYHYGSDAKVSTYTWMHNSKCIYERFVRDLEDLILPMEEGANEDR